MMLHGSRNGFEVNCVSAFSWWTPKNSTKPHNTPPATATAARKTRERTRPTGHNCSTRRHWARVVDHHADALQDLFRPVTVAVVALITFRDGLRTRLREAGLTGIPLLVPGTAMIAAYLTAEQESGRLAGGADIDTLAPTLVGAGHLLFAADRTSAPPQRAGVRKTVTTVIAGALRPPQS
jgi:hypothetical protein